MLAVIKKEFKSYFSTPIGYIFIGLFLVMFSIFFYTDVVQYGSTNFEYIFYSGATILTFIVPILTMRTFAEERKSGTEQLILTAPISLTKVILGKFISSTLIVLITELCTFMYFAILCFFGMPHLTTAIATLIGFSLLAMAYISFGIFASSLTENQIIAGVLTIGFFILTWFLPQFNTIFTNFSLINLFAKFPQGQIDLADTVTFITFTITFILLTLIVLKRKKIAMTGIIIAIFIGVNVFIQSLNLEPIDLSQEQLYTLTQNSKDKVKNINKDVNIYFVGYNEDDSTVDLAKQYKNSNDKIKTEVVTAESRPDLVSKYGIENGSTGIIIESGEKYKVLTANDLYTYDNTTYETINIAEEKLTSSIMTVVSEKVPKIYFLEGYSDEYSLLYNMKNLSIYLANEVNEVESLNILTTGKVPDDCDTLIICTPSKDFDEIATQSIIEYINSGRNILWLNSIITEKQEFTNVNKILSLYGVNPFEVGMIMETDPSKMVSNSPYIIYPNVNSSTVTKNIYNTTGVLFIEPTKINFVDSESLENLNVEKTDLLIASSKSFFRKNFGLQTMSKVEGEQEGEFVVGAELVKTIKKAEGENQSDIKSKMIIYGENNFITDRQIKNSNTPILLLAHNKDLILNSMAYLVDRQEDITARKSTGTVTYTATDEQNLIIQIIIFLIPVLIIIFGIGVWIIRRKK